MFASHGKMKHQQQHSDNNATFKYSLLHRVCAVGLAVPTVPLIYQACAHVGRPVKTCAHLMTSMCSIVLILLSRVDAVLIWGGSYHLRC
jgi:hypothetical protein